MSNRDHTRGRYADKCRISRRMAIGGALSAICFAGSPAGSELLSVPPRPGVIRFGLTPVFLSNDLEVLDELQAYLVRAVGQEVQLVTQRTYQEVTALLVSGILRPPGFAATRS